MSGSLTISISPAVGLPSSSVSLHDVFQSFVPKFSLYTWFELIESLKVPSVTSQYETSALPAT